MLQPSAAFLSPARPRTLARWLYVVAAMIVGIVVVGGITRLTESGLSITEWKPLTGIVPPITNPQWQAEFANYRRIPQYAALNSGMTLAGFKAIFFWEYLHRFLGRFIGLAYLVPLIWFAVRRRIPTGYTGRLIALFALILLQGTFGWLMVKSGLTDRTEVAPGWLALHLVTALFTLAGMVWTALDLRALDGAPYRGPARLPLVGLVALVGLFVQIMFGAFTAGLRAGYAFASWPLMGDRLFPADVPMLHPTWTNAIDNPIVVQFIHRWWAFAAAAALVWLAVAATRAGSKAGFWVVGLVTLQIFLGIATLMTGVMIDVAVAHQANAALLLIATVIAAHAVATRRQVSRYPSANPRFA
ncbi:COX15/CtaA family protein [Sphingomonas oligophenolica]|uniref:Heme A synthase n=1 Tax=Sphingomonas oligophenolica TaxID=301154 RepID=A0A502CI26_9SPHN|nr:COX15/CtaA family protein [Sphingomonas oligophenolica]TPG12290.1 heme A synthase [Sphingomonas oligophenolica]